MVRIASCIVYRTFLERRVVGWTTCPVGLRYATEIVRSSSFVMRQSHTNHRNRAHGQPSRSSGPSAEEEIDGVKNADNLRYIRTNLIMEPTRGLDLTKW